MSIDVDLQIRRVEALGEFLKTDDGATIMPSQYIRVAEPAGLMSVVDNVLLFRCIQILGSLNHRAKDIGVFCNLSRETLQDAMFFSQFIEFMKQHRDLAGSLIFEISQETLSEGTPAEIAAKIAETAIATVNDPRPATTWLRRVDRRMRAKRLPMRR